MQRDMDQREIHQQNRAYREMEEMTRKSKEVERERQLRAEQEEREKREVEEERKVRKMSIPDEPTSGKIVRISFRCPNGSTIFRNFASEEKLELVYHWVELNEDIEFEDSHKR